MGKSESYVRMLFLNVNVNETTVSISEMLPKHLHSTDFNFIELILESGKICASALNFKAQTAIHLVPCKTFTYFVNGKRCFHGKLDRIGLLNRFNEQYLCRGYRNEDNFVNITWMLLEHNVNVNQKDCKGKTALMKACKAGCLPVVSTKQYLNGQNKLIIGLILMPEIFMDKRP